MRELSTLGSRFHPVGQCSPLGGGGELMLKTDFFTFLRSYVVDVFKHVYICTYVLNICKRQWNVITFARASHRIACEYYIAFLPIGIKLAQSNFQ
jgi:hypothetical protein